MKFTATQGGIDIADGVYPATLMGIEEREGQDSQFAGQSNGQRMYLRWTFQVYHTDDGAEMTANSSLAFGPKAKARKWMEALLGRKLAVGEEVDPAEICPADCQVIVKKEVDSGFSRIEDVLGARKHPNTKAQLKASGVVV